MRDDLNALTLRTQDDLREIARMFAEAGRYHTAVQVQGFAALIAEESSTICGPTVARCDASAVVKIAS